MSEAASLPGITALVVSALRPGRELLAGSRALARDWRVERTPFLDTADVACEADYKRRAAARGRIGFRSVDRTLGAIAEVHETCRQRGVTVDRFGITFIHEGLIGTAFIGRIRGTTTVGGNPAILPTITGKGWIMASHRYVLDPSDPFPLGFRGGDTWPASA